MRGPERGGSGEPSHLSGANARGGGEPPDRAGAGFTASPEGVESSYEALRARLVSLGYLERPLDRYVLSGIARPGSFLRRHAVVSLKVALAGGPLLGLLFALAVVVVNRPRFSRPLDFLWLAIDFTLLFGALVFVLELVAGLTLAALVRWRGRGVAAFQATASRTGFAVSLLVSAYLAFWWRRRAGGGGGGLVDAAGLLALLTVNAALLRISSLASLAALIRVSDLPPPPSRRRSGGSGLLAAVAAMLLTIGFLLAPRTLGRSARPPFERVSVEGRMLVIGWDGIPAALYERILRGGESPQGPVPGRDLGGRPAYLARVGPPPEGKHVSRPGLWTDIATGRPAAEHGVGEIADERLVGLSAPLGGDVPLGLVLRTLLPGRRVAVSAGVRRAKTSWEILSEKEGVGVVGWWATWPALDRDTPERPFAVVSDRAVFSLQVPASHDYRIAPASLAQELNASFQEDLGAARMAMMGSLPVPELEPEAGTEQAALIDGWAVQVALRLLAKPRVADLFVYLPGLDIVRTGSVPARGAEPSGELVEAYARYVRGLIDRLAAVLHPEDWLVLVGDPGRAGAGLIGETAVGGEPGWIEIAGPGVGLEPVLEVWKPLDITPTLLNLRGFPKSREMLGSVHVGFLASQWRDRLRIREIPTYGDHAIPALPSTQASSEEEILERLHSLGYLN